MIGGTTLGPRRWSGALVALGVLALATLVSQPVRGATVQDIRIAPHGRETRIVLELSQEIHYQLVRLDQPPRLAIDLPDVAWLVPESFGRQSVGLVQSYRFGRFRPGVSRLT
ncbi:MAG: AMIN domain-containing protein, partial [Geminicoccales bacterium]